MTGSRQVCGALVCSVVWQRRRRCGGATRRAFRQYCSLRFALAAAWVAASGQVQPAAHAPVAPNGWPRVAPWGGYRRGFGCRRARSGSARVLRLQAWAVIGCDVCCSLRARRMGWLTVGFPRGCSPRYALLGGHIGWASGETAKLAGVRRPTY